MESKNRDLSGCCVGSHVKASPTRSDVAWVRETAAMVLRTEGDALLRLAGEIPPDFSQAVDLILDVRGRVVVSGIGKSGHIARKIAATLASTGTPAQFVHPAEASHGDLGMVTENDVCILLSNSGETAELSDLIAHTRRFSIPLIGISGRANSTLIRAADLRLVLPDAREACVIGITPTTSTTMTLALGDALAVAVMQQRGFKPDHFHTYHPGGKLGAKLAKVSQLMRGAEALPLVCREAPMSLVLIEMTQKGFGVAGLVDEDAKLVGIITDGDLRRHMSGLMEHIAEEVATTHPVTVPPDMLAAEAVALMNKRKVHMVFVVDIEKRPVGIIRIHDCLHAGVV